MRVRSLPRVRVTCTASGCIRSFGNDRMYRFGDTYMLLITCASLCARGGAYFRRHASDSVSSRLHAHLCTCVIAVARAPVCVRHCGERASVFAFSSSSFDGQKSQLFHPFKAKKRAGKKATRKKIWRDPVLSIFLTANNVRHSRLAESFVISSPIFVIFVSFFRPTLIFFLPPSLLPLR